MSTFERRCEILIFLCKNGYETRENLAYRFGVCKRTIESDVQRLSLKFPIFTKQGNGGGIFINPHFRFDRPTMTEKQLGLLKRLVDTLSPDDKKIVNEIIENFG